MLSHYISLDGQVYLQTLLKSNLVEMSPTMKLIKSKKRSGNELLQNYM